MVFIYVLIASRKRLKGALWAKGKDFNATLVTNVNAELGKVAIMPQEMGRVLLNLYNNAFYAVQQKQKTTPANYRPTVSVSTTQVNGRIEIRVSDNGTGRWKVRKAKERRLWCSYPL